MHLHDLYVRRYCPEIAELFDAEFSTIKDLTYGNIGSETGVNTWNVSETRISFCFVVVVVVVVVVVCVHRTTIGWPCVTVAHRQLTRNHTHAAPLFMCDDAVSLGDLELHVSDQGDCQRRIHVLHGASICMACFVMLLDVTILVRDVRVFILCFWVGY